MNDLQLIGIDRVNGPERLRIDWFIGKRCNYDCSYCGDFLHDNTSGHKSFEQLKLTIDNIAKWKAPEIIRIGFTGGEPTVNPVFLDFCRYLKDIKISYVSVTSNGTRTKEYYLNLVNYVDSVMFSQHFEFSDVVEFTEKIKNISKINKNISVQVMVNANYFDDAKYSVNVYKENNIKYTLRRIRDATMKTTAHLYTQTQLEWILKEQQEELSENNTIIFYKDKDKTVSKKINVNKISANQKNKFKNWICWAGIYTLTIWNDDLIYRGSCQEGGVIGSVYDNNLNLPTAPIICNKDTCVCAPEISVRKYKTPDEINFTKHIK